MQFLALLGCVLVGMAVTSASKLPTNVVSKSGMLVNVRVVDAQLNQAINGVVNFWALNSKSALQLPITAAELVNVDYIDYTGPAQKPNTRTPAFGYTFGVSADFFTDDSYLALEIYNNVTGSSAVFVGGQIGTVAQLKQLPHYYQVPLVDQTGATVGTADISWN